MDIEHAQRRRFSHDEMAEILDVASRLDRQVADTDEVSLDELRQIGMELGISADAIDRVIADRDEHAWAEQAERDAVEWRRQRRARRWRHWRAALARSLTIVAALFVIDLATGWPNGVDGLDWWFIPAGIIGVVFLGRTLNTLFRVHGSDVYPSVEALHGP